MYSVDIETAFISKQHFDLSKHHYWMRKPAWPIQHHDADGIS